VAVSSTTFLQLDTIAAPAVSAAATARFYPDSGDNTFKVSINGGAYATVAAGATNTLQAAYDAGGTGAGRAISFAAAGDRVTITNNAANNNGVLLLEKTPVGAQSGTILQLTAGANATGAVVNMDDARTATQQSVVLTRTAAPAAVGATLLDCTTNAGFAGAFRSTAPDVSGDARKVFLLQSSEAFAQDRGPAWTGFGRIDGTASVFEFGGIRTVKESGTSGQAQGCTDIITRESLAGTLVARFRVSSAAGCNLRSDGFYGWSSTANVNGTLDLQLGRVAANVLGIYATSTTGSTIALASGQQVRWSGTTNPGGTADFGVARETTNVGRISDGTTGIGFLQHGWRTTAHSTSPVAVATTDAGRSYTNEGAAGEINFNLPGAAAGLVYRFFVQAAQNLRVTAAAGDTIRLAGSVSAAAGNIVNATIGGVVELQALNATEWLGTVIVGTWTVT
jgi:hypothetical protein